MHFVTQSTTVMVCTTVQEEAVFTEEAQRTVEVIIEDHTPSLSFPHVPDAVKAAISSDMVYAFAVLKINEPPRTILLNWEAPQTGSVSLEVTLARCLYSCIYGSHVQRTERVQDVCTSP